MALQGPIPISFDQVFPEGCYAVGGVEPVYDFDASTKDRKVQARDKNSGEPVWQIAIMDADPTVKASQKTVALKITSMVQPAPPPPINGMPFTPVEFDGMTVTPYVNQQGRLAYSIKAREMRAPRNTSKHAITKEATAS